MAKLTDGENAAYNTVFNVASLTNLVTCPFIALLKLVSLAKWI